MINELPRETKILIGIAIMMYCSQIVAKLQFLIYEEDKAIFINQQLTSILTIIIILIIIYWSITNNAKKHIH